MDHYRPRDEYPHLAHVWSNWLLSCHVCNSACKGNAFPLAGDGSPLLLNVFDEDPLDGFLQFEEGFVMAPGNNPRGRATIAVLRLHDREDLSARRKMIDEAVGEQLRL